VSIYLLLGAALAVGALGYVLQPLFRRRTASAAPTRTGVAGRDVTDDEIEEAIRSYRAVRRSGVACPNCGSRPEPDALYCSSCGRPLAT